MEETTIAKLRNVLSPIYSLTDMVLLLENDDNPKLFELVIKQAKQVIINKERIIDLLNELEK